MIRATHLALQVILAVTVCCASSIAAKRVLPARVLHFAPDHSIGGVHYSAGGRDFVKQAQGDVSLPAGAYVKLKVNYAGALDLSPLAKLPPDAIQRLSFRNLELKDEELKNIVNLTGLEEIDFEETYVSDKGLQYLQNLKNVHTLDFRATDVKGTGLAKLKPLTRLVALTLNNCDIADRGLEELAQMKSIHRLYIASAQISDEGLKKISPMSELICLDISKNKKITTKGLSYLVEMKKLQELRINDLRLDLSTCIPYLQKMPSLNTLVYNRYILSPRQIAKLQRALPHCHLVDQQADVDMDLFAPLH